MASQLCVPMRAWLEDALAGNAISTEEATWLSFIDMCAASIGEDLEPSIELKPAMDRINFHSMPVGYMRTSKFLRNPS